MLEVVGPVIIEDGKILLVREQHDCGDMVFMLPGGKRIATDVDQKATCKREAKEELGIEIDVLEKLNEMKVRRPGLEIEVVLLVHYMAKRLTDIVPGPEILEWGWFPLDDLPQNVAPNIKTVVELYKVKFV